jgi:hypothetical protein
MLLGARRCTAWSVDAVTEDLQVVVLPETVA